MILPDYPIEKGVQDLLRRLPLAQKVAAMISSYEGKESFVIGVEGKWGAGKTSFVNLTLDSLDKEKTEHFVFNPWVFSDEASLLRDFFTKYGEVVEQITGNRHLGKKARDFVGKYAGKLSDIDIPLPWWAKIGQKLLGMVNIDASIESIRKELNASLVTLPKKIVVVIDDIDRLDRKETKLIFKLVKLTADFPNTIFILAYDRDRIEDKITDEDDGIDGGEYLKKIIQVSFTLPLPDQQELQSLLFKDLDKTIRDEYKTDLVLEDGSEEERRWHDLFRSGFGGLFDNIRDIKRYISSLRLDWSIMGTSDVNKIDFLGIEAVRVFAPRFYAAIPANKEIFVETPFSRLRFAQNAAQVRQERYNKLLETLISDEKVRECVDELCKELFPQLSRNGSISSDTSERELLICHPDRFPFYFQLGIPSGEMSESKVDEIIATLADKDIFSKIILQAKEEKQLRKVLEKLVKRVGSLDEMQIKVAISALWELEPEIDDEREAVFDLDDVNTRVLQVGYHGLKKLAAERRKPVLEELCREAKYLYYPIYLLHVLEEDHDKETQRSGQPILQTTSIAEVVAIMLEKIKTAAQNGSLQNEKHLNAILYRWKAWESADAVSAYIRALIATRAGLLTLLQSFVGKVLSSAGNYYDLEPNAIAGLYSVDEVRALINAIPEDEIAKMNAKEKQAIDLFKNRPRRW